MNRIILTVLFFGLISCEQSKSAALKTICITPVPIELNVATPENRAKFMVRHLSSIITNPEVIRIVKSSQYLEPDARRKVLKENIAAEGISTCSMLEAWTFQYNEKGWTTPSKGMEWKPEPEMSWLEKMLYTYTPY